jgi:hypothetical protein
MITEFNPSLQDQKNPCFPITITYLMRLQRQKASYSSFTRRHPQRSDLHLTATYSSDYHLKSIDRKPIYTKPKKIGTIGVRTHLPQIQNLLQSPHAPPQHRVSDLPILVPVQENDTTILFSVVRLTSPKKFCRHPPSHAPAHAGLLIGYPCPRFDLRSIFNPQLYKS